MPGTTEVSRLVLVIERSAVGVSESTSVAELLPAVGSTIPAATVPEAVLLNVPVAPALTAATTENVAVAPTGRLTVVLIEPLPEAEAQPAPALGVHVHEVNEAEPGCVSTTAVFGALDGPLLVTTTV